MKEILRTCVVCRTKQDQKNMTRIVKTCDDSVVIDEKHKVDGRGAYVCKNASCVEKAKKSKVLDRQLKISVPTEIYNNLQVNP